MVSQGRRSRRRASIGAPLLALVSLLLAATTPTARGQPAPSFPLQFTADLEIISHLVDRNKDYPPWRTRMTIQYDHVQGLAKADIKEGHQEGKLFIRRYDQKWEYMVKGGIYPECLRSYLGEKMPLPELPPNAIKQGVKEVEGESWEHWMADQGTSHVHVWFTTVGNTRVPRRLTHAAIQEDGTEKPLMTYDLLNLRLGPQALSDFSLPKEYTHDKCKFHLGGFPYIHAFHFYLRF